MYMAANGLVANAAKTVFMMLNLTKAEAEKEYEECLLKAKAMFEVLQISNNKKVQV